MTSLRWSRSWTLSITKMIARSKNKAIESKILNSNSTLWVKKQAKTKEQQIYCDNGLTAVKSQLERMACRTLLVTGRIYLRSRCDSKKRNSIALMFFSTSNYTHILFQCRLVLEYSSLIRNDFLSILYLFILSLFSDMRKVWHFSVENSLTIVLMRYSKYNIRNKNVFA